MVMGKGETKYCGCLYYSANALSRVITKMAEEEFAITGLAPSYAFLLMGVNSQPGIQMKALSELMQLTPSTVTRLIEKMEFRGYVSREVKGRATEVYPTDKSLELDGEIKKAWMSLYRRYSDLLGEEAGRKLTDEVYAAYQKLSPA